MICSDTFQAVWVVCALFFALGHAVAALIVSGAPTDEDQVVEYTEWMAQPLGNALKVSFAALIVGLAATWWHAISENEIDCYVVAAVLSLFALIAHATLGGVVDETLESRAQAALPRA